MALVEILTTNLAGALLKALTKLWLKDYALASAGAETVIDTIKKHIADGREQRATLKLFIDLENEVEERLQSFIEVEFPTLPANEKAAAADSVAACFGQLQFDRVLFQADLDASRLELALVAAAPRAFHQLGAETTALAELLRRECCNYVVRIAHKLPRFGEAASRELLLRTTTILETLRQALDELAAMRQQSTNDRSREAASFEDQYRRAIVQHLDRMEIFGVRITGAGTRDYDLTSAYVPLTAVPEGGQPVRVEEALAPLSRIVIRGEAGFGKTTLMQWLAVQAARRGFVGSLRPWNDRLPFYLRLRDFRGEATHFPAPEEFLGGPLRHLAALLPERGWVHKTLQSGALVLIDGLDEVPAKRRALWLDWVRSLERTFEASVFAVSSRPAALDADVPISMAKALAKSGFQAFTLEPMSASDSQEVVHRWHDAVARDLKGEEVNQRLREYERSLRQMLRERPTIRALASNPLLCAMMCALNWDRQQRLPDERMELYRLALELLLDRREHERGIEGMVLDRPTKEILLGGIAVWMLIDGLSEAERERVENQLTILMRRLPHLTGSAPEVLQELLERSGVLREPQHGLVDFVHRTFLEYLGARALIDQDNLGYLVDKAREESWREVVVFAAGHAQGRTRDDLISRLLRGRPLWRRPVEADVTAICCFETVGRHLDPDIMAKLRAKAAEMFPPIARDLAPALAPAAASDPSLLKGHSGAGELAVATCIRIAGIIGTPPMLDVIAEYAAVDGAAVEEELARAMPAFDEAAFEAKVLAKRSTLFGLKEPASEAEQSRALRLVLRCSAERGMVSWNIARILKEFGDRGALELSNGYLSEFETGVVDDYFWGRSGERVLPAKTLRDLNELASLRSLSVGRIEPGVMPLLGSCAGLEALMIDAPEGPMDLTPMASLRALKTLICWGGDPFPSLQPLRQCPLLERIWLLGSDNARLDLDFIGTGSRLRALSVEGCVVNDFSKIRAAADLSFLQLVGCRIGDYAPLGNLPALRTLRVLWPREGATLPFKNLKALESLSLWGSQAQNFYADLSQAPALTEFDSYCDGENTTKLLAILPNTLNRLTIQDSSTPFRMPGVIDAAKDMMGVLLSKGMIGRVLGTAHSTLSLAGINRLTNLEEIAVKTARLTDSTDVVKLPRLRKATFSRCTGDAALIAERLKANGVTVVAS